MDSDMTRRVVAEAFGTFWLTFGGCGAAVFAAGYPALGIGFLGVAFAFGLTVLTMAYAVGHISGGHFNPAVTAGLAAAATTSMFCPTSWLRWWAPCWPPRCSGLSLPARPDGCLAASPRMAMA